MDDKWLYYNDLNKNFFNTTRLRWNDIRIKIVTGTGYIFMEELERSLSKDGYIGVSYYHALGVMSDIMEQCQLCISSNGRMVFELAQLIKLNPEWILINSHIKRKGNS